jgi:hypothetical protein
METAVFMALEFLGKCANYYYNALVFKNVRIISAYFSGEMPGVEDLRRK